MNALRPRATLEGLRPYAPEAAPVDLDLSDNVNLWGLPPAAVRALGDLAAARPSVYPPADPVELRAALADYAGVQPAQVITGCGSDDIVDSAIRAFTCRCFARTCTAHTGLAFRLSDQAGARSLPALEPITTNRSPSAR